MNCCICGKSTGITGIHTCSNVPPGTFPDSLMPRIEDLVNATVRECIAVEGHLDSGDIQSAFEAIWQIGENASQMRSVVELGSGQKSEAEAPDQELDRSVSEMEKGWKQSRHCVGCGVKDSKRGGGSNPTWLLGDRVQNICATCRSSDFAELVQLIQAADRAAEALVRKFL